MRTKRCKIANISSPAVWLLLIVGALATSLLWSQNAWAQPVGEFDDSEITRAICDLYKFSSGAFGAIFALAAGIGALVASAFGLYRSGIAFLVVSVGFFTAPALVSLSFGEVNCTGVDTGFNDVIIQAAICERFMMIEGSWGALIMTIAGIISIIMVSVGAYRAGYTLVVVGCGAFIMRALISLFHGDLNCDTVFAAKQDLIGSFFQTGG